MTAFLLNPVGTVALDPAVRPIVVESSVLMALSVFPQTASSHASDASLKAVFARGENIYIQASQSSLVVHTLSGRVLRFACCVPLRPLNSEGLTISSLALLARDAPQKHSQSAEVVHVCVCGQTTKGGVAAVFALSWLGSDEMFAQIRSLSRSPAAAPAPKCCAVNNRLGIHAVSYAQTVQLWRLPASLSSPMLTKPELSLQPCAGQESITAIAAAPCGSLLFVASSSGSTHCYAMSYSSGSGAQASYLCTLRLGSTGAHPLCLACTSVPSPLPAHTKQPLHGILASTVLLAGLSSGETAVYWLGHALRECRLVCPPPDAPIESETSPDSAAASAEDSSSAQTVSSISPVSVIPCLHASQAGIASVQWLPTPPSSEGPGALTAALQASCDPRWKLLPFALRALPPAAASSGVDGAYARAMAASSPSKRKAAGWSHSYNDAGRLQWVPPPVPDDAALFDRYFDVPSAQQASTAPFVSLLSSHPPCEAISDTGSQVGPFLMSVVPISAMALPQLSAAETGHGALPAAAGESAAAGTGDTDDTAATAAGACMLPVGLCAMVTSSEGSYLM